MLNATTVKETKTTPELSVVYDGKQWVCIEEKVPDDGNCAFSVFRLTRIQARQLFLDNLADEELLKILSENIREQIVESKPSDKIHDLKKIAEINKARAVALEVG